MSNAFRLVATILCFVNGAISITQRSGVVDVVAEDPALSAGTVEMVDVSSEMAVLVAAAVGLFGDASLELPPLVIRGGDPELGCEGHDGTHRRRGGWSEIELCAQQSTDAVFHTVLHELAHAWAAHGLSSARKAAFQELRGFEFWRNYAEAAWEDNGTEQAAEIIAWGVSDRPAGLVRIDDVSCGELHEGFVALTQREPLHGLTSVCEGTVVSRA